MSAAPKFIAFEGIDGSGTTTQAKALHAALEARGGLTWLTHEPSSGPIGRYVREILAGRVRLQCDAESTRRILAYLFAADRDEHRSNSATGVIAKLASGHDVICARYTMSSFAYEGGDGEEASFVATLNERFPDPDLLVFLDCPVDVALSRIAASRAAFDIFENRAQLERVAANYARLLATYSGRLLHVDATRPIEEITRGVLGAWEQMG